MSDDNELYKGPVDELGQDFYVEDDAKSPFAPAPGDVEYPDFGSEDEQAPADKEYPKFIDFDYDSMKKTAAKYLGMVAGISVLLIVAGFVMNDRFFVFFRRFGVLSLITAGVMFVILLVNSGRVVKTVRIETDGFFVNDDHYDISGTTVKIAPTLPIAGKADNIYITVKSAGKKKKYWAGCNDDPHAEARRDRMKSELARLSPTIVK